MRLREVNRSVVAECHWPAPLETALFLPLTRIMISLLLPFKIPKIFLPGKLLSDKILIAATSAGSELNQHGLSVSQKALYSKLHSPLSNRHYPLFKESSWNWEDTWGNSLISLKVGTRTIICYTLLRVFGILRSIRFCLVRSALLTFQKIWLQSLGRYHT